MAWSEDRDDTSVANKIQKYSQHRYLLHGAMIVNEEIQESWISAQVLRRYLHPGLYNWFYEDEMVLSSTTTRDAFLSVQKCIFKMPLHVRQDSAPPMQHLNCRMLAESRAGRGQSARHNEVNAPRGRHRTRQLSFFQSNQHRMNRFGPKVSGSGCTRQSRTI